MEYMNNKLFIAYICLAISILMLGVSSILNTLQISEIRSDLIKQQVITEKLINLDSEIIARESIKR